MDTLVDVAVEQQETYTVASKGYEVRARKVLKVGSLELSSSPLPSPPPAAVSNALLTAIESLGGVNVALLQSQSKRNLSAIAAIRRRIAVARKLTSDDEWPGCFAALDDIDDKKGTDEDEDMLVELVKPWLAAAGSIKGVDMHEILKSSLSPDQLIRLDQEFPSMIQAADGSSIPLDYKNADMPMASVKLQQFFGATESPMIGPRHNCIPISLSLLSPSGSLWRRPLIFR